MPRYLSVQVFIIHLLQFTILIWSLNPIVRLETHLDDILAAETGERSLRSERRVFTKLRVGAFSTFRLHFLLTVPYVTPYGMSAPS